MAAWDRLIDRLLLLSAGAVSALVIIGDVLLRLDEGR